MKLRAARLHPYTLRLAQPFETARGVVATREGVLLELQDAEGNTGFGEAAPWPGFGTETVVEALAALRRAEPLLPGSELEPGVWPDPLSTQLSRAPAARAALDGALWDLAARRADMSLATFLLGRQGAGAASTLARVRVSALLTAGSPGALREQAAQAREAGHLAAKLKLGAASLAIDLERVRAARDGLGPDLALRGDANGGWTESQAREALAALAEFHLEYVEQPVPANEIDGLARLRRTATVRIAADESVSTEDGVARLLQAGAADVLVLKPASLGGPGRALEIASRVRQAGCDVVFTHAFESAIGACHALHCAAAWGEIETVHGLATTGLFEADLAEPPVCLRGELTVPQGPGLGITVASVSP